MLEQHNLIRSDIALLKFSTPLNIRLFDCCDYVTVLKHEHGSLFSSYLIAINYNNIHRLPYTVHNTKTFNTTIVCGKDAIVNVFDFKTISENKTGLFFKVAFSGYEQLLCKFQLIYIHEFDTGFTANTSLYIENTDDIDDEEFYNLNKLADNRIQKVYLKRDRKSTRLNSSH